MAFDIHPFMEYTDNQNISVKIRWYPALTPYKSGEISVYNLAGTKLETNILRQAEINIS